MAEERVTKLDPIRLVIEDEDWNPDTWLLMWQDEDGKNRVVPKHRYVNTDKPFFATRYYAGLPSGKVFHNLHLACEDGSIQDVTCVKASAVK